MSEKKSEQRAAKDDRMSGTQERPLTDRAARGSWVRRTIPAVSRHRRVLAIAGTAAALAVVVGVSAIPIGASAAPMSPVAMTTSTAKSSTDHWCRADFEAVKHHYDRLPDALRKDIQSADHQSSKSARHDALQAVLKKAQSGSYGSAIESAAKDKKSIAGVKASWDRLPSALRDDLKKAKEASGSTRIDDVKAIVSKAESGGYGSRVEDAANAVKTRLDKCLTRVSESPSTSTPSPAPSETSTPSSTATAGA